MTDNKTVFSGLRITHVADASEGYVHAPVEPEIPVQTDGVFKGLRVIVHTLPTAVQEGMAGLGDLKQSRE